MIESPLLDDMKVLFQQLKQHDDIIAVLDERFGAVPDEFVTSIRAIRDSRRLTSLVRFAASCPDLEAFRIRLAATKEN